MGLYFEEWKIGEEHWSSGVTISEAHVVEFCAMTQLNSPLCTDEEYAKTTIFGHRIAPGMLVISLAFGLTGRTLIREGTIIAGLGTEYLRFLKPVFIGDTIKASEKTVEKKGTKDPKKGIVTNVTTVVNQKGEVVAEYRGSAMYMRK